MNPTRLEWLQRVPLFGALSDDTLDFLLEHARELKVPAGEYFFREGDQADALFVLESGRAAVIKGWRGEEIELRRLEPGECFGEMALLDLFPRSASVRALADSAAIELGPQDLHQLYHRNVAEFALIQMNIGRELSRRLRATDEMLFRARMGESARGATVFGSH
jgi:CRP/FNR family transcriptional regulator, cyclic AMP receptor protein